MLSYEVIETWPHIEAVSDTFAAGPCIDRIIAASIMARLRGNNSNRLYEK